MRAGTCLSMILRKMLSASMVDLLAGTIAGVAPGSNHPATRAPDMAWVIGIDEAGYGPNLGPFVMTAVACRVSDGVAGANLWQLLGGAVRSAREEDDGRLLVDDSKVVYSTARGLLGLERGVLATLWRGNGSASA